MKLIRFGELGSEKPGVEIGDQRYDCSKFFKDWNRSFFQGDGMKRLQDLIDSGVDQFPEVHAGTRWGSPVARPGMILCVGLNYSDHAKEANMAIPEEPILFMKATNTIVGPYDNVALPRNSQKTDWEVELGIVMGKDALYLDDMDAAEDAIAGFCVVHDLSERAFQLERGGQWVKGKSCPDFSPIGPYMVSKDEVGNVMELAMSLTVNGITKQSGNTRTMIFSPKFVVHYISQFMKLEAGDVISTGTPPGVGLGMNPPEYLHKGDVVRLEIEKLGHQQQTMT